MHTIRSDPIRGVAGGVAGVDLIRGCINRIILRSATVRDDIQYLYDAYVRVMQCEHKIHKLAYDNYAYFDNCNTQGMIDKLASMYKLLHSVSNMYVYAREDNTPINIPVYKSILRRLSKLIRSTDYRDY